MTFASATALIMIVAVCAILPTPSRAGQCNSTNRHLYLDFTTGFKATNSFTLAGKYLSLSMNSFTDHTIPQKGRSTDQFYNAITLNAIQSALRLFDYQDSIERSLSEGHNSTYMQAMAAVTGWLVEDTCDWINALLVVGDAKVFDGSQQCNSSRTFTCSRDSAHQLARSIKLVQLTRTAYSDSKTVRYLKDCRRGSSNEKDWLNNASGNTAARTFVTDCITS